MDKRSPAEKCGTQADDFEPAQPPTNLPALVVCDVGVRQDAEGRYCLNDLHRASGGAVRHQPKEWLKTKQAQELNEALENEGFPSFSVMRGRNGGTYVPREGVYAYAEWISAKFHLKVIRTFDALVTGKLQTPPDPQAHLNDPAWLRQTLIPRITPTPAPPVCDCGSSASHSQPAW